MPFRLQAAAQGVQPPDRAAVGGAHRSRRQRRLAKPSGRSATRDWLPSDEDRAFVASLMGRVAEPGKFANWIAPPARGINSQPIDFEYVRFN